MCSLMLMDGWVLIEGFPILSGYSLGSFSCMNSLMYSEGWLMVKRFPTSLHWQGFSPVCAFWCTVRFGFWKKTFSTYVTLVVFLTHLKCMTFLLEDWLITGFLGCIVYSESSLSKLSEVTYDLTHPWWFSHNHHNHRVSLLVWVPSWVMKRAYFEGFNALIIFK